MEENMDADINSIGVKHYATHPVLETLWTEVVVANARHCVGHHTVTVTYTEDGRRQASRMI
jgi:hypothetical protein